jgi:putative transport protein
MPWYTQLITGTSVAGVVFGLSLAAAVGIAVGTARIRGFTLGIACVLFAGIAVSDLLWSHALVARFVGAEPIALVSQMEEARRKILEFLREFGLILFVYSIGMEVGPGFLASLRKQGLRWNLVAVLLVALDVIVALGLQRWARVDPVATIGILSGAVTNTPGLAAAEQALADVRGLDPRHAVLADVGCAVSYPFGIVGAILALVLVRRLWTSGVARAAAGAGTAPSDEGSALGNMDLCVLNPALAGHTVGELGGLLGAPVVISRMLREGSVELPGPTTELRLDDLVHAVGDRQDLERLAVLLGGRSGVDVRGAPGLLGVREVVVTRPEVTGQTLRELRLRQRHGVNVTRVRRAGLELVPDASVELRYGDSIVVVGDEGHLAEVERLVGNAVSELQHPQMVPIFIGIAAGVLLGIIPISISGLPSPVRLGLAGGPLLVALLTGHLGRIGRVSFYLPQSASLLLRSLGIVLFLGCVGLLSGERFVETLVHGPGLRWIAVGAAITLAPLLATGLFALAFLKLDFDALCGVIAGGMTSPPALSFASQMGAKRAAVAYGAVYPLAMLLRVVSAQIMVLLWVGGSS